MTKLSPFLVTYLVLTELGDEFVTKFSEHQIRHQKWWQFCHQIQWSILWQYWWATNLVINFSPNLVNTNVGDKFSDKFVTLFSDHQIRWQICHRICHQICHQNSLGSYMFSTKSVGTFSTLFNLDFDLVSIWMRQPYWRRLRTWTWRNPLRFSKAMGLFRFVFKPLLLSAVDIIFVGSNVSLAPVNVCSSNQGVGDGSWWWI